MQHDVIMNKLDVKKDVQLLSHSLVSFSLVIHPLSSAYLSPALQRLKPAAYNLDIVLWVDDVFSKDRPIDFMCNYIK